MSLNHTHQIHNQHTSCLYALLQPNPGIPPFLTGHWSPWWLRFEPLPLPSLVSLAHLHLVCWEANGDIDCALGEWMRMWVWALALDHRSRCALWSQILCVCVGREFVVLWMGQTLSEDQLTLEFISSETRSDSARLSFLNCLFWQESVNIQTRCVDAPYDKWKVNHRKVRPQGEVNWSSVELSRCGHYQGIELFLCFHWHEQLKFKTGHFWQWFTDWSHASITACGVLSLIKLSIWSLSICFSMIFSMRER